MTLPSATASVPTSRAKSPRHKPAIEILLGEHRAYGSVIRGTGRLVREIQAGRRRCRIDVFRAVVDYVDAFPEHFHHRKEDGYLFRYMRLRCPDSFALLELIETEHKQSVQLAHSLDEALRRCERNEPLAFDGFGEAIDAYASFHREHMRREEEEVFPLAEAKLRQADWAEIDSAFRGHTDPLFGAAAEAEFGRLLKRIVAIAPPPLGAAGDD